MLLLQAICGRIREWERRFEMTQTWKRTAKRKIARLSATEVRRIMDCVNETGSKMGHTIMQPEIRALTGGYNSQSINFYVMRMLWERVKSSN